MKRIEMHGIYEIVNNETHSVGAQFVCDKKSERHVFAIGERRSNMWSVMFSHFRFR